MRQAWYDNDNQGYHRIIMLKIWKGCRLPIVHERVSSGNRTVVDTEHVVVCYKLKTPDRDSPPDDIWFG